MQRRVVHSLTSSRSSAPTAQRQQQQQQHSSLLHLVGSPHVSHHNSVPCVVRCTIRSIILTIISSAPLAGVQRGVRKYTGLHSRSTYTKHSTDLAETARFILFLLVVVVVVVVGWRSGLC